MIKDMKLSVKDKKVLSCIIESLQTMKKQINMENIRQHPMFELITEKEQFDKKEAIISSLQVSIKKEEKDTLCIKIRGTGIDFQNQLHRKFLEDEIPQLAGKITGFVHVTNQLGFTPTSENTDVLSELINLIWKKN